MKFKALLKNKFFYLAILIISLIVLRIYLPQIVKNYANKTLANIPGYYGHVEDIDLAIYRGAYVAKGLILDKTDAETRVPFVNLPEVDISLEWKSLFRGRIVSEIYLYEPEVIYVKEDNVNNDELENNDWTEVLYDLVPISINHFEIINGKIAYVEKNSTPDIDIQINQLDLTAKNLESVKSKKEKLPSSLTANAYSIGNGKISLNGNMNFLKQTPDVDLNLSLEKANITSLNPFVSHYANMDFDQGNISIYTECAIADNYLKGYSKVLLENTKLIGKEESLKEIKNEILASGLKYAFKNHKNNTLALKVPFDGDLSSVDSHIIPTAFSIIRNAFIKAAKAQIDDEVEYEDALEKEKENDTKWWQIGKLFKKS